MSKRRIPALGVALLVVAGVALCQQSRDTRSAKGAQPGASARSERYAPDVHTLREAYERAARLASRRKGSVFKAQITPHWFHGNSRFWYRNDLRGGTKEFVGVDAERGTREAAFDHAKLAASLSKAAGAEHRADKLPFDSIEFSEDEKEVHFRAAGSDWRCDLESYECSKLEGAPGSSQPEAPRDADRTAGGSRRPRGEFRDWRTDRGPEPREEKSPDGKWTALVRDYNVMVRANDGGEEFALSDNGSADNAFGALSWSPNSKMLVAYRIEPAEVKNVYFVESSPREGGRAKLHSHPYALPGDKFTAYEMWLFDVERRKSTQAEVERIDFGGVPRLRWKKDGQHFTIEKTDRGHQRFRVIEIDAQSGEARNLIDEKSDTFVDTYSNFTIRYFDDTEEILWKSERDGWSHLYLIDAKAGTVKNRVTQGPWVVRGVDRVDEKKRQIWFRASGRNEGQDPYFIHYYRVNFDGTDLVALTEGDGNHALQYSPDREYIIDTYSRVDMPPIHELRRASDGALICKLERADVSALRETGWNCPEVFHAEGRDGQTDIWGVVYRPGGLDETKKYPVIESIYAGPHGSFVPKTFSEYRRPESLAELGFIVVQIDGMGTNNRSKAFHDVCWHNVADAGFPDRILWLKALAERYSYVDLDHVGVYGTSAGGQSSTGALLFHPEFYKVAVSSCGCHDNRMDKASWNEQWMGYPVGEHYAEQSNITNAHKLRGKLMLIVGEMDTNVPPESTLRLVDALIKANKDFDLLMMPGMSHTDGGRYGERRRMDFFVRHLHGVEPPDRNAVEPPGSRLKQVDEEEGDE